MNNNGINNYWSLTPANILQKLQSSIEGLSNEAAQKRLKEYGYNEIEKQKSATKFVLFLNQLKNPIILILVFGTIVSASTGDLSDAAIILAIIFGSAILSFLQEYRASNAIEELRAKVQIKSFVLRAGNFEEIPARLVVPGDILKFTSGSFISVDGLVLEASDFFINQSILTGESIPSEKKPGILPEDCSMEERTNCVFMGTNVHRGNAIVLAVATGETTEFGQIAGQLKLRPPETDFERGVRRFGYLLTQIMLILTLTVFAVNVFFHKPVIDSLLFSVALAVGITPQMLPAIVSITLSKGYRKMAKEGVIVRRLEAIENFGSMDTLCTDKTGTLTEGDIRFDGAFDIEGKSSEVVFRLAYLNARLQTSIENSLDDTIVGVKDLDISTVKKLGEVSLDFTRERLSIIVEENNKSFLIMKGALNHVLETCKFVEKAGCVKEIDSAILDRIYRQYEEWSNQGIRVLGVAKKNIVLQESYTVEDEESMTFIGFLLLFDHPKKDVAQTIIDLAKKGIDLRVITGDNRLIAMHTTRSVGLEIKGVLTGAEIMKISDEALWGKVDAINVFAEVDPNQKERIILALKKKGHVVGYMGDGINDVPALHAADVSISVDNAVDVAKESADFVLMEKSLEVLKRGVELGRMTFANTLKYIFVTTSCNFGNMFSMAGASLFMPFLPLLPKQILLINFLSDFPALTIANDSVDEEVLEKPRRWDIKMIRNFMFTFGFISSVFDYVTFGVLLLVFETREGVFQSSWFVLSILTELLILVVMRTQRPFFKSKPASLLLYTAIGVGLITIIIPYLPISSILNIEPIPPTILLSLLAIAALYIVVTEIAKYYFYKERQ
ncbi:MAG: magnesium-translocating P-type ATPase [Acidaminococcaceae bacterium]